MPAGTGIPRAICVDEVCTISNRPHREKPRVEISTYALDEYGDNLFVVKNIIDGRDSNIQFTFVPYSNKEKVNLSPEMAKKLYNVLKQYVGDNDELG